MSVFGPKTGYIERRKRRLKTAEAQAKSLIYIDKKGALGVKGSLVRIQSLRPFGNRRKLRKKGGFSPPFFVPKIHLDRFLDLIKSVNFEN